MLYACAGESFIGYRLAQKLRHFQEARLLCQGQFRQYPSAPFLSFFLRRCAFNTSIGAKFILECQVAIHGMHGDRIKKETKVKSRCREPHWEAEQFEFPIRGKLSCGLVKKKEMLRTCFLQDFMG